MFHFVILPDTLHNCDFALTFIKNPLLSAKISSVFLNPKTLGKWTIMLMDLRSILQLVLQILIVFSCCVINFLSPIKRDHYPIFILKRTKEMIANLRMEWMENVMVLRECELHKLLRTLRCKASRGYNRPFYRCSSHIELIRFTEYYRMPREHEHISFVFSSAFRDIFFLKFC